MFKKMTFLFLLFSLLMVSPISSDSSGGSQEDLRQALKKLGYSSIGLKQNIENQFEVKGSINGTKEITLIINFSWPNTLFDKQKLDELNIECFETGRSYSLNGDEEDMYATTIDSLNIGDGKIAAMDIMAVEYEEYDFLEYTRAAGILGRDFLLKHNAILDYGNQVLYLKTN